MKSYNLNKKAIKELGKIIKTARLNQKKTVLELAKELDVNTGYISKLENGNNSKSINILLLKSISKILGLNYIELIKKIGYLDPESIILNLEDISKLSKLFQELKKELGLNNENFNQLVMFFQLALENCYQDNMITYETISEIKENKYSKFSIKSFKFNSKNVNAFFKKIDSLTEENNGKYFLVEINHKIVLKKLYIEKNSIICIDCDDSIKPIIINKTQIKLFGILHKTTEECVY